MQEEIAKVLLLILISIFKYSKLKIQLLKRTPESNVHIYLPIAQILGRYVSHLLVCINFHVLVFT